MAYKNRTQLKAFFEMGDTPPESNFVDFIDSVLNLQEDVFGYGFLWNVTAFNGGGQANAIVLTYANNHVENSVNPGDSVKFTTTDGLMRCFIVNTSGNAIDVFPPVGYQINNLGANNAYALANNTSMLFFFAGNSRWFTHGAV